MSTAHVYLRCSTAEQADSRLGLEAQLSALQAVHAARFPEYTLLIHTDPGQRATGKRPSYARMLKKVRRDDLVLFLRLDRIARSVVDFGGLVADAKKRGFYLVCLDPDLDLTTANGRLVANVLMAVAEWEADMISQRTREALAAKAARGEVVGSKPRTSPELEDRIVRMRRGMEPYGPVPMTYRAIAEALNADGVAPMQGKQWWLSSVAKIVQRCAPPGAPWPPGSPAPPTPRGPRAREVTKAAP